MCREDYRTALETGGKCLSNCTTMFSPLHETNPLSLHCLTTTGHACVSCKWTSSTKWIIKWYSTYPCREVLYSLASIYVEARVQYRLRAAPWEQLQWLAREDLNKAASCWQRGVHSVHFPKRLNISDTWGGHSALQNRFQQRDCWKSLYLWIICRCTMSVPPLEFYRWLCLGILSTHFLY